MLHWPAMLVLWIRSVAWKWRGWKRRRRIEEGEEEDKVAIEKDTRIRLSA